MGQKASSPSTSQQPDLSLGEFGYAAQHKFSTIQTEEKDGDNWYYFEGFKMMLYHNCDNINSNTTVEDVKGRHVPATLVFGRSIQYIKEHILHHMLENGVDYIEDDTKWVITVPAIWTDRAKGLMREAATEVAGIRLNKLTIALEPECAAIYCCHLTREQLEIKDGDKKMRYIAKPGSVIIVVDIGGGTVDITTVRVREGETLEHIHKSGGGPCGGMNVNDEFFMMLAQITGQDVFEKFRMEYRVEYFDLQASFEQEKSRVPANGNHERFNLLLPAPLKELWERKGGHTVKDLLQTTDIQGIHFANSRLAFPLRVILELYDKCTKGIIQSINSILSHPAVEGLPISAVLAVGGFAKSGYVVDALRNGLIRKEIPVLRPEDTEIAVVKGAVLFGHKEHVIYSRIMPYTYGVACVMDFNTRHRKEHKYYDGKKFVAKNCFSKHVTRGQTVELGKWIDHKKYYPDSDSQLYITIHVFASDKIDPTHTDEEGCKFVGKFDVKFPQSSSVDNKTRAVQVALQFGDTELQVKATNHDGTTTSEWLNYT
ncbi:heat shock 70 kDa protein 12B-like isoform X2 [Dreissena polymorpha]|uniref:heat shock 70 kDa protein 12B-like isoform X2 n=1 Tax=Dreissena polymorpha TaxID=45954 RepID=UPI0022653D73|nr:heat shock 70 kDa protein 12B-like isoform X2 [Dreissena polymorpha]